MWRSASKHSTKILAKCMYVFSFSHHRSGMPCLIGEKHSITLLNNETAWKGSECCDGEQLQCVKITLSKTRDLLVAYRNLDSLLN